MNLSQQQLLGEAGNNPQQQHHHQRHNDEHAYGQMLASDDDDNTTTHTDDDDDSRRSYNTGTTYQEGDAVDILGKSFQRLEEDDPEFVLQYSTVGGVRQREDEVIAKHARKIVTGSVLISFVHGVLSSSSCCLLLASRCCGGSAKRASLLISRMLLALLFLLPCVWCIVTAGAAHDLFGAVPAGAVSIKSCVFSDLGTVPAVTPEQLANLSDSSLRNVTSFFFASSRNNSVTSQNNNAEATMSFLSSSSVSECVFCNNDSATVAHGGRFRVSSVEGRWWSPYVFAVLCNLLLTVACVVTFHRLELRRRVAAHFLAFGTVLTNRWTWKRKLGVVLFVVLWILTAVSCVAPVLAARLVVESSTSEHSGSNIPFALSSVTSLGTNAPGQDLLERLLYNDSTSLAAPLSCFAYRTIMTNNSSNSNTTISAVQLFGLFTQIDIEEQQRLFYESAVEPRASFLGIATSLLASLLPYVPVVLLLYQQMVSLVPLHSVFAASAIARGDFDMLGYLSHRIAFHCDLDVVLKAVSLLAQSTNRLLVEDGQRLHDHDSSLVAGLGGDDGDGLILSWCLAMTVRAGWTKLLWPCCRGGAGGGLSTGRWTSDEHPHELLFGSTWGCGEEDANSVLSILHEHRFLKPVKRVAVTNSNKNDHQTTSRNNTTFEL